MITIQTKDGNDPLLDVTAVQSTYANGKPGPALLARAGYTLRQVNAIPTGPGVLRWQVDGGKLIRYVAPPTPQQQFDAAVAAGYTVPGVTPPLVLDLGDGARAQFTGLTVLLDKLMASGQLLATTTQAIADKMGALHSLPVSQIDQILVGYGAYYAGLYNTLHAATVAAPATAGA